MPMLAAEELRVRQILLKLLSKAITCTAAGGSVEPSAMLGPDGGVVFQVADTAIGMAPESIPVGLEPFRQIASALARQAEGTGLGLSLVKSLVEQHGGE
jgi:signal transduction histidine kinase